MTIAYHLFFIGTAAGQLTLGLVLPLVFFDNASVTGSEHWKLFYDHLQYLSVYLQFEITAAELEKASKLCLSVWARFGTTYGAEQYRPKAHFATHLATTARWYALIVISPVHPSIVYT